MKKQIKTKKLTLQKDTLVRVTGGITVSTYYRCTGPTPTFARTVCVECPTDTLILFYCCFIK